MRRMFLAAALCMGTAPALAADLAEMSVSPKVMIAESASRWDGFYVGGFAGYFGGTLSYESSEDVYEYYDFPGWLLGVSAGYDTTLSNGVVVGVVADVAATSGSLTVPKEISLPWSASLRGRVGKDFGSFLPYISGGLAVAPYDIGGEVFPMLGWTAGAGVEMAVTENITLDAQYRFTDFGVADTGTFEDYVSGHHVTAGLNWRF